MRGPLAVLAVAALVAGMGVSGCAYYNTFFHAEQYYDQAVDLQKSTESNKNNGNAGSNSSNQDRVRSQASELFSKCISKCEKLIDRFPRSKWRDDASLLMAKAYYGKKDYLSAKGELLRMIDRFPDSDLLPEAYYQLGLTYYRSGNQEDARRAWKTLDERFPDAQENRDVSYYLAHGYEEEGNLEAAGTAYETYIESQGRSVQAYDARLDRADMRLEAGDVAGAREDLLIVREKGRTKQQRLQANLLLAQAAEADGNLEEALQLYWDLAYGLDPNYALGRMTREERAQREKDLADKAAEQGVALNIVKEQQLQSQRKILDRDSWEYESLARVMLNEGQLLAKMDREDEAIRAFDQVIDEYPKSDYASEAQFRIGYTFEVYLEDLDRAEQAYKQVSTHGRSSFSDDALRRAGKLSQVKSLKVSAPPDSLSNKDAELAKARFLKAELFLFQQQRPEKAVAEYEAIQRDFAGTDYEAKAALAEAYVRLNIENDPARGRAAMADVMKRYENTEYGVYARRILKGPEPEPKEMEFAGPSLGVLLAEANLAQVTLRDSLLTAEAQAKADRIASRKTGGGTEHAPGAGILGRAQTLNLYAVPPAGNSPILSAWDREPRVARSRLNEGFPSSLGVSKRPGAPHEP